MGRRRRRKGIQYRRRRGNNPNVIYIVGKV